MTTTTILQQSHKNKAFTSLLAFLLGTVGAHRFYLHGARDRWGWLHLAALPAAMLLHQLFPEADWFYQILPLTVSALAGFLEALVLGLLGFLPGLAIGTAILTLMAKVTTLPLLMTPGMAVTVFVGTVVFSALSGVIATRRLAAADPADLF